MHGFVRGGPCACAARRQRMARPRYEQMVLQPRAQRHPHHRQRPERVQLRDLRRDHGRPARLRPADLRHERPGPRPHRRRPGLRPRLRRRRRARDRPVGLQRRRDHGPPDLRQPEPLRADARHAHLRSVHRRGHGFRPDPRGRSRRRHHARRHAGRNRSRLVRSRNARRKGGNSGRARVARRYHRLAPTPQAGEPGGSWRTA